MVENVFFFAFIGALILERITELLIARRNEKWILLNGGKEIAAGFSKLIVIFHITWFAGFLAEGLASGAHLQVSVPVALSALVLLQAGRYWCIRSLGKFWNTKVLILPGATLQRRGPYKWFRHPNYLIVIGELLFYPLLFDCIWTALIGSMINGFLLKKRIAQEVAGLQEHTNYRALFADAAGTPD